ncbi:MAG: hypothetical protein ACTHJO_07065 [Rhodanobacter sp.]
MAAVYSRRSGYRGPCVDQYCVVVCGLRAGASDEASRWAPVATALRMEHDEFFRRVVAALPRIVRQQLDRSSAERIAQLLQGLHVDARALPSDEQLVYIERDGSSRGPLPRSALDAFIAPGESYRLHGSLAWQIWPEPLEHESSPPPTQAFDEVMAAPVEEAFAAAPAEPPDDEPSAVAATSSPSLPPPLPTASTSPANDAAMPEDQPTPDHAPIDPPSDGPLGEADVAAPPDEAATRPPRRSRLGRMLLLLALVGVAAWAYLHRGADTHVDDSPPPAPVGHAQPASSSTAAAAAATSVATAPAMAASTAATSARSTPAPATSVPASGGTTALPATTATTALPAATSGTTARPGLPAAAGSSPRS